jgi:hypothetical protein
VASVSEKAMEIDLAAVVAAVSDRAAVEVKIVESSPVLSKVFFSYRFSLSLSLSLSPRLNLYCR